MNDEAGRRDARGDAELTRRLAEYLIHDRSDLQDLEISLHDTSPAEDGISFRFHSPEGEHLVELRRADWHHAPPAELASEAAREAMKEWRIRRRERRRER